MAMEDLLGKFRAFTSAIERETGQRNYIIELQPGLYYRLVLALSEYLPDDGSGLLNVGDCFIYDGVTVKKLRPPQAR